MLTWSAVAIWTMNGRKREMLCSLDVILQNTSTYNLFKVFVDVVGGVVVKEQTWTVLIKLEPCTLFQEDISSWQSSCHGTSRV